MEKLSELSELKHIVARETFVCLTCPENVFCCLGENFPNLIGKSIIWRLDVTL